MQGGVGHGHAAHKHGRELGHGREFAGAPHLHVNGQHRGDLLLRRVFVRHRPARLAAHKAQALLQRQCVDLVDHAVNVIGQLVAQRTDALVKGDQAVGAQRGTGEFGHRETPGLEREQQFHMRAYRQRAAHLAHAIGKKAQRPLGGNGRVELAHGTGGGVARVDEGFLALVAMRNARALALVERLKIVAPHIDLAAHFQHLGHGRVGGRH